MLSKRKPSTKSRCDRSIPDGSNSQHVGVVPKVEFSADSIDHEEVDAYWTARGEVKPPVPVLWVPAPFKTNHVAGFVKMGSRPLDVSAGFLNQSSFAYQKVNPCGLHHLVGILVLSYELGITLGADHLEALVEPRWSTSLIVQVRPRTNMAIISEFISKYHFWKEQFFFVRVSDASVEASSISVFRTGWGKKVPEGLLTVRELLRGLPCFWADFSPKRVRRAVALYRSRFQPDLSTEEGSESSMDGFIPYVPQTKRDRSKPRKDKHLMVDEDVVVRRKLSSDQWWIQRSAIFFQGGEDGQWGSWKVIIVVRESRSRRSSPDYSFASEYAKQTGNMAEKDKDLKFSEVEEEIWEQWEPVPVSPDTVEAELRDPGEAGEVDQPVAPLNVNDYSIVRSMSGDFDLGD
ncbi:BnaC01g24160D [Brassica napus]|uniref:BnaC01g24160D protein n=1 Tax=Brassica napus TaxID=3708 RepID=A0A078GB73_BRANA|nr:BnaC01g24160D [Brassica napus]